ncbi:MAG: DNA recombination/repair protein RecA, partial [Acidimicrobiaceae bacterium]
GAWFTYDGEQLGQGRENAKQFLAENTEVMVQMADRVRQQSMPVADTPAETSSDSVFSAKNCLAFSRP